MGHQQFAWGLRQFKHQFIQYWPFRKCLAERSFLFLSSTSPRAEYRTQRTVCHFLCAVVCFPPVFSIRISTPISTSTHHLLFSFISTTSDDFMTEIRCLKQAPTTEILSSSSSINNARTPDKLLWKRRRRSAAVIRRFFVANNGTYCKLWSFS